MKSLDLQYVLGFVDDKAGTKKGKTATVYIVKIHGKQYAFKRYRQNAVKDLTAMEDHISSLFEGLGESKYNEMMIFGAFPKCLVHDQKTFCGFLMDVIPRECYAEDQKDRHLGAFYGIKGEINNFSNQQIGQYVKCLGNLIYDLHKSGFILGDALNDQNLYVRVIDNQLYPYLVDTDSLRKDRENPAKTYHSPNFAPPEGEDSPSSKASDIYKYCLIVLRLFSRPEKEYERAGLRIEDPASKGSLQRIRETLGDSYKEIVVKGLQEDPAQRPQIQEIVQAYTPKRITALKKNTNTMLARACDLLAERMSSGDDYSISKPINGKNILITLNGIRKIEEFFGIANINDPANAPLEKEMREAICRKENKKPPQKTVSNREAAAAVTAKMNASGKNANTEKRRKKRNVAIVAAALAACLGGFTLLKTGALNFGGNASTLSDSFISSAKQGDEFTLGKYEQDNNLENGAEDIEWVVVNNEDGDVLAVSKYCLDNKAFNESETYTATDWESCSLRQWLNQDFYDSAFTDDEKGWICTTNLHNTDADFFKTPGGNNTIDRVFLLGTPDITSCYSDYKLGFLTMNLDEENKRMVKTTADTYEALQVKYTDCAKETYIQAQCESWENRTEDDIRADYAEIEEEYGKKACAWWLRTPGDNWYSTMSIKWSGAALDNPSQSATMGVRPAIIVSEKTSSNNNTDTNNSTANSEAKSGSEIAAEEYAAIDNGIPVQIIQEDQQMLFTLENGKVGRIGYDMGDYSDISGWDGMKKVAVGNGIVIGLTNEGTLQISTALEYEFDKDSLLKLSGIEDVCICEDAVNPENENQKGCIICLANDGRVYFSYNGGYGEHFDGVKAIDASSNKFALLKNDGTVLGKKYDSSVYAEVSEWSDMIQVVCGENFIAGLKADGTVTTSGNYLNSNIDGSSIVKEDWSYEELNMADDVSSWSDIVCLSAGSNHLTGLRSDGTVLSNGINNYGQCGTDDWTGIVSVEASNNATVGYMADGSYRFAGKNIISNVIDLQDKYTVYLGYSG